MKNIKYELESDIIDNIRQSVAKNTWYNVNTRIRIWDNIRESVENNILQSFAPVHQVLQETFTLKPQ